MFKNIDFRGDLWDGTGLLEHIEYYNIEKKLENYLNTDFYNSTYAIGVH